NQHGAWRVLGFASLGHYAVERLGMSRRTAESRAGIFRAGHAVPAVSDAYEKGRIGLGTAWLLRRILRSVPGPIDVGAQESWIQHAKIATIKRLRHELRRVHLRAFEQPFDDTTPQPSTDADGSHRCGVNLA